MIVFIFNFLELIMFFCSYVRVLLMLLALTLAIWAHPIPSKAVFKGQEIHGVLIWEELENGILRIFAKAQPGSKFYKALGGDVLDVTGIVSLEDYDWEVKNGEIEFTKKNNLVNATTTAPGVFQQLKHKFFSSLFGDLI